VGEISVGQTVHVELLARDRFRRKRAGPGGRVYRVAEAADDSTGLFEVEILISNSQGKLKPGQIGLAHVVVAEIRGFRVPMTCAVFRDEETYLFTVDDSRTAHRLDVAHWIEQGPDMILEELPPGRRTVVVRGQHRLVEGCGVRLVSAEGGTSIEIDRDTAVRTPRSAS